MNVSDLAVCQRCPALLGYKVHMGKKNAWRVGIQGNGHAYGSMFHNNIAQPFFAAAADPKSPLHAEAARAVSEGREALEEFIRVKIFMPFMEAHPREYSSDQIMAAARAVEVWVKAMADFFAEIPSLKENPESVMSKVFLKPEGKLSGIYEVPGEGSMKVIGKYDALLFNPDKAEARLFEFKGYSKSDLAVPLSQSLLYAWLIAKQTGIIPSVEIIYLDDEDREPSVFSPRTVREMIIAGLPGLLDTAFHVITLRRMPEILTDKDICRKCMFKASCAADWKSGFGKRPGASMVNVLVFFMAAVMIMAQVFFFSRTSAENISAQADALSQRLAMDERLQAAITDLKNDNVLQSYYMEKEASYASFSTSDGSYKAFCEQRKVSEDLKADNQISTVIYNLDYVFSNDTGIPYREQEWKAYNAADNLPKMIFAPVSGDYYLIRVYKHRADSQKSLMYQVFVHRTGSTTPYTVNVKSFQEVWY